MTSKEFVAWVQGYYGNYPDGQKRDIWEYITSWEPDYLAALKSVLLQNYSSQYKRPPDIEAMTKLHIQAADEQRQIQRQRMAPKYLPEAPRDDDALAAQLRADMKEAGVTFDDPRWFSKTFIHRCKRGDFGPRLKANPPVRVWEPQGARA